MAGEGAGKSAGEIRGTGGSAGKGAARGVSLERNKEQHSLQHPEFPQHSSQRPPQPFLLVSPFLCSVAGQLGRNARPD